MRDSLRILLVLVRLSSKSILLLLLKQIFLATLLPNFAIMFIHILLPAESWTFGLLQSPGVEISKEEFY